MHKIYPYMYIYNFFPDYKLIITYCNTINQDIYKLRECVKDLKNKAKTVQ